MVKKSPYIPVRGKLAPHQSIIGFDNRTRKSQSHDRARYHTKILDMESDQGSTPFERDIDKIKRSPESRRERGIYQFAVPIHLEGQYHYQDRLTHTYEAEMVARITARRLHLGRNSIDLAIACVAIHDIAHPPFTHWGEQVMGAKLAPFGRSWKHDPAGLRVVTEWSNDGLTYPGLNLTMGTLEGLAKRYWRYLANERLSHYNHPYSELPHSIREIDRKKNLYLDKHNHVEGQIAAISDWIAFTATDIEDGLRSGWMTMGEVFNNFPIAREVHAQMLKDMPKYHRELKRNMAGRDKISNQEALNKIFSRLIRDRLITDLVDQTNKNVIELFDGKHRIESNGRIFKYADDVREADKLVVDMSPAVKQQMITFQDFCVKTVHHRMIETIGPVKMMVSTVIDDFVAGKLRLSPTWQERYASASNISKDAKETEGNLTQLACDFLVQELTDAEVIVYFKNYYPDLWNQHFAGHTHPQKDEGRFNKNALIGEWTGLVMNRESVDRQPFALVGDFGR